jgi:hypothetical protein
MKTKLIIILLLLWAGVVWGQNTRKELTTVKELVDFLKDNDKSISNDIYNPINFCTITERMPKTNGRNTIYTLILAAGQDYVKKGSQIYLDFDKNFVDVLGKDCDVQVLAYIQRKDKTIKPISVLGFTTVNAIQNDKVGVMKSGESINSADVQYIYKVTRERGNGKSYSGELNIVWEDVAEEDKIIIQVTNTAKNNTGFTMTLIYDDLMAQQTQTLLSNDQKHKEEIAKYAKTIEQLKSDTEKLIAQNRQDMSDQEQDHLKKMALQDEKVKGLSNDLSSAQKHIDAMVEAIKLNGWDGEWFLRAYDYFGNKVGSNENEEGKIFIESNGWCTMAGIGLEEGMVAKALDSVKERLDCEHGIVLNNPAFTKYYIEYGEISSYPPGYKENAGIFCHNNPWIMIGETVQGRGDRAWEYFRKICPSYTEEISDLHKVEPYVYAQMIAGKDAFKPGEAKNSWLTGTAAWNYYAITQYILGIQPTYKGLRIEPCIAPEWKGFAVTRKFRGATYLIEVKNPNGAMKGVASLTVDGKLIEGNIIPLMPEGRTYKVEVLM